MKTAETAADAALQAAASVIVDSSEERDDNEGQNDEDTQPATARSSPPVPAASEQADDRMDTDQDTEMGNSTMVAGAPNAPSAGVGFATPATDTPKAAAGSAAPASTTGVSAAAAAPSLPASQTTAPSQSSTGEMSGNNQPVSATEQTAVKTEEPTEAAAVTSQLKAEADAQADGEAEEEAAEPARPEDDVWFGKEKPSLNSLHRTYHIGKTLTEDRDDSVDWGGDDRGWTRRHERREFTWIFLSLCGIILLSFTVGVLLSSTFFFLLVGQAGLGRCRTGLPWLQRALGYNFKVVTDANTT